MLAWPHAQRPTACSTVRGNTLARASGALSPNHRGARYGERKPVGVSRTEDDDDAECPPPDASTVAWSERPEHPRDQLVQSFRLHPLLPDVSDLVPEQNEIVQ